jgi:2-methylcitrate dehydratase
VNAALEARRLAGDSSNIKEVHIRTSQSGLSIMADGPEKWRPGNRETADHSITYTAAVALMFGTVELKYFDEKYLHDEELLQLASRIKCSPSEEATRRGAKMNLCELDVTLGSGERKTIRVEYHRGHWRNPMSDAEMEGKFRSLIGTTRPAPQVDALLGQLWHLEELREVAALVPNTQMIPPSGDHQ